ncbi:hypothetical protein MXB_193, partial [Myxobolus squamalis]
DVINTFVGDSEHLPPFYEEFHDALGSQVIDEILESETESHNTEADIDRMILSPDPIARSPLYHHRTRLQNFEGKLI